MVEWLEAFAAGTDHLDPIARMSWWRESTPLSCPWLCHCVRMHTHTRANNASTVNN